jgi:hypothetical protein
LHSTRFITTGLAAALALAIVPSWAAAAPSPLSDDSLADFSAGTGTDAWAVEPGSVRLKPAGLAENFDGAALPAGWVQSPWSSGGSASVAAGALTVDGARANTAGAGATDTPTLTAPQTLEFEATFGRDANQHVGFGNTFDDGPWAMFSTGAGTTTGPVALYPRVLTAAGGTETTPTAIAGLDASVPHVYRIEWSTTDVKFYVDRVLAATQTAAITAPMRPIVSDFTKDPDPNVPPVAVKVDWLAAGASFPASGTFESRVLTADDARTVWGPLTAATEGGAATIKTRSGNTLVPDASWSDYQSLGAGNAIQSPAGHYIQYEATLADKQILDSVSIPYTIDDAAPAAAIDGVQVSGTTATARFSSAATDVARFDCSLDGAAFATCTSPKQFTGLAAGSHSLAVRAVDKVGNVGDPASTPFRVEAPAAGGGGGGGGSASPPPVGAPVDTTAPKVTFKALSSRVSKTGKVTVRVGCPASETSCKIAVALKSGRTTLASKKVTVNGGKTANVSLRLSRAARRQLAKRGHLKVKAVIGATDSAGNKSSKTLQLTLRA